MCGVQWWRLARETLAYGTQVADAFGTTFARIVGGTLRQPASRDPLHRCAWKPTLSYVHHLKEEQLRRRRAAGHATLGRLGTINHQESWGVNGISRPWGEAKRVG